MLIVTLLILVSTTFTFLQGAPPSTLAGLRMCYNGPKAWQLGWFSDYHVDLSSANGFSWTGNLVGFAQKANAALTDKMIIKIQGSTDTYINFNRQIGMNSGTQEGGNQVLVTRRATGTGYASSTLVAKLSANGVYTIPNFSGTTSTLRITVNSIVTSSTPGRASLSIDLVSTPTQAPTQVPTKAPTRSPTKAPTESQSPTQVPTVTQSPSQAPSGAPTEAPSQAPTGAPTQSPTTLAPTAAPTTRTPTLKPTTRTPTLKPTTRPPTRKPTNRPPTRKPTNPLPTRRPTRTPTLKPTTRTPTLKPSTAKPV